MGSEYVISYATEWETEKREHPYSKRGITNKGNSATMHATACDIFNQLESRIETLEDRITELESYG